MNTNVILWVIPSVAFLGALLLLARQMRTATSRGVSFASVRRLKPEPVAVGWPAGMEQPQEPETSNAAPRWSARTSEEKPKFDSLSRENLARICSRFGIRSISILPSIRRPRGQAETNVDILVEFEPAAKLDYTIIFRLRQELFAIVGRRVELVCRNSAELAARQEMFEKARVLYAA